MLDVKELQSRNLFEQSDKIMDGGSPEDRLDPGTPMSEIINRMISRRAFLRGSIAAGAAGVLGVGLSGCTAEELDGAEILIQENTLAIDLDDASNRADTLNFQSVMPSSEDLVTLPEGYKARVFYAYGDPTNDSVSPFSNNGTEPGVEFDNRSGDHHDGIYFFGMDDDDNFDPTRSDQGVLCINHENITQALMHVGVPSVDENGNRTNLDEVRKEQRAHGVSCIAIRRIPGSNNFEVVANSPLNRRITSLTGTDMAGPAAGSSLLHTRFSPTGTHGRGTLNNCGHGFTPWGTYLTCEENYDLYFRNDNVVAAEAAGDPVTPEVTNGYANFLSGAGVRVESGLYGWATLAGHPEEENDEFARFNITPTGAGAANDYRNEANQYGYIVEIDPFNPEAAPRKRTGLGRFAHEGCWPSNPREGQPMAFYMGDDDQLQFIYKFVSDTIYDGPANGESALETGDRFMDEGTLYVARFVDFGGGQLSGQWIPLRTDNPKLRTANESGPFQGLFGTLDSILVHARGAAFTVGATPMDRPEWSAVDPNTGEIYLTLTNNSDRRAFDDADEVARMAGDEGSRDEVTEFLADREFGVDSANPRGPNSDGHIIRMRENGDTTAATSFTWDIFLFGANIADRPEGNFSGLDISNEFTDCDGLWFDNAGVLWIQTDGGQPNDSNDQMLAAITDRVGEDGITPSNSTDRLRRFLVGPVDCEITGITQTPDRRTLFINVQHPGADGSVVADAPDTFTSNWPAASGANASETGVAGNRARSATIMITREDGGLIGSDFTA